MKNRNKVSKRRKILITGGAGFIGSSLILNLQDKHKIICLDRDDKYSQLKKFINSNVKLVRGDITNEALLDKLVKECNIIIHLAGGGGNSACVRDPIWAVNTHILGTHLQLKKALKYKVKKFIFASSQSVYTTFHKRTPPLKEEMRLEPDDFYGTLKKIAEDLINSSGINYFTLRLANVYGNSEVYPIREGGAINNFIRSALNKEKLQIYGSGKQGIDYVHLKDIIRAFISVLKANYRSKIYNVGSGKLIQIEEIAKIINDILKDKFRQEVKIKKIAVPPDKIWPDRLMSIKKIKKELGWSPKVSLKAGIEEMIINSYKKK